MADPNNYVPSYSYSGFQQDNPTRPLPAPQIDNDFAKLQETTDEIISAVRDVRRSDGALRNGIVTADALATDILIGLKTPSRWQTGVQYKVLDTVIFSGKIYRCVESHVSGNFEGDLAAERWTLIFDLNDLVGFEPLDVVEDNFVGDGTTDTFTISRDGFPKANSFVVLDGVLQETATYSLIGDQLTLDEPPVEGASIQVRTFRASVAIVTIEDPGGGGGGGDLTGAVRFDQAQSLTEIEKARARLNIGAGVPGSGGTGGFSVFFASRAEAQAGTVDSAVNLLTLFHSGRLLQYQSDATGTALTTGDGRKWSPAEAPTFLHWGAVGNGVVDDTAAIQAALNFFVNTQSPNTAYRSNGMRTLSGYGRQFLISSPIKLGNITGANGPIFNLRVKDFKFICSPTGNWTDVASFAPGYAIDLVYRINQDKTDDVPEFLYNIIFENFTIDCGYATGGMFFENTNSVSLHNFRIDRMGKNKRGLMSAKSFFNERGFSCKNGAFLASNGFIQGYEESTDETYPAGEDQVSMETAAIHWQSVDFRFTEIINNRTTYSWIIEDCGAGQIDNCHPWSREVIVRSQGATGVSNIFFTGIYFDFTKVRLINSWNVVFDACRWLFGPEDRTLVLEATQPNTTAEGLIIDGCYVSTGRKIEFTTSGSGSWVAESERRYIQSASLTVDDTSPIRMRYGRNFRIGNDGVTRIRRDAPDFGEFAVRGNFVVVGENRTVAGYAAFELNTDLDSAQSDAYVAAFAGGGMEITNRKTGALTINRQVSGVVTPMLTFDCNNGNADFANGIREQGTLLSSKYKPVGYSGTSRLNKVFPIGTQLVTNTIGSTAVPDRNGVVPVSYAGGNDWGFILGVTANQLTGTWVSRGSFLKDFGGTDYGTLVERIA